MNRVRLKLALSWTAITLLATLAIFATLAHEPLDALFALAVGVHYVRELV